MKMNYIVNTRHSEDAYRVYAKVHMEARATPLTKAVSILVGLFCIAGGVMAMMNGGFRVLYAITVLVGVLCILSQPLGLWNMRRRLLKNASNIQQNIDYFFDENGFTVEYAKQKESCRYADVKRIVETADYFFVYTDVRMAHILSKKDFSQGDPATFRSFLEEKTGLTMVEEKA